MPETMETYPILFADINVQNIKNQEILIKNTFPISYSQSFYNKVCDQYKELSCYAILKDVIIGAITCRVEDFKEKPYLYIMTLAVFDGYRRGGVATQLFDEMMRRIEKNGTEVHGIYIHTPEWNEAAIKFYEKKDFAITDRMQNYYTSLDNPNAVTLEKILKE